MAPERLKEGDRVSVLGQAQTGIVMQVGRKFIHANGDEADQPWAIEIRFGLAEPLWFDCSSVVEVSNTK